MPQCSICWDCDHNITSCHYKCLPNYIDYDKEDKISVIRIEEKIYLKIKEKILNGIDILDIDKIKKEQMEQLLIEIYNINENNHGENTQLTASEHENSVMEIISNNFNTEIIIKENFRKFIEDNGRIFKGDLNHLCDEFISIENNSLNLEIDKNYLVKHPGGGQEYPDLLLFKLDNENNLQLLYIECKQLSPTFNNNPPKKNKNCHYICGNQIYNGYLLLSDNHWLRISEFIRKHRELCEELSDEVIRFIPYKKIEPRWISNRGTKYFIENENQNIPLIIEGFSRFL